MRTLTSYGISVVIVFAILNTIVPNVLMQSGHPLE